MPDKVNSLRLNPQLVIALHSPNGVTENWTGDVPSGEKQDAIAVDAAQSILCSPVYLGKSAKYGHCSRISVQSERNFSCT